MSAAMSPIECVGNEHALKACVDAARKQGVVVQTGLHPQRKPDRLVPGHLPRPRDQGLLGLSEHYWPRVIRLIASGLLPATKIVTKRITLETAVKEGFDVLLDPAGTQLKILIDLSK